MNEINKHPMRWMCVDPGDWADIYYKGTIQEKASMLDDFVEMLLKNKEPQILENKIILAKSHSYWDKRVTEKKEYAKKRKAMFQELKAENKELKSTSGISEKQQTLFDDVKNAERPTREEAISFAESIGATLANDWYDWSENNNWCDKYQKPIRNWKRAFVAYEKTNNPDFNPPQETAQQQENEQ
ncbi:MAG: hypothetical protein FWF63_00375 [Fibromonadales bacterium]|nr:hypothetical protein [Fibromonadales bacterium]